MRTGSIFILVRRKRVLVSRTVALSPDSLFWQTAANAFELENAAIRAVLQQGGCLDRNGRHRCPDDLAAQARFDDPPTL